jgi:hypothetical protein
MAPIFPELSVNINQKRWTCVLDPALALSPFGLPLVKRLGAVMQVWVAREHLHILDNTPAYMRWPEKLHSDMQVDASALAWPNKQEFLRALVEWDRMRLDTDPAKMKLHWIGDSPGESILPDDFETAHIWRFEALSSSLDNRLKFKKPLVSAFRDAIALSVTLPSALILTQLSKVEAVKPIHLIEAEDTSPLICKNITHWDIELERVDTGDDWLRVERDFLQHYLVWAGLAKLHWSGLKLAVLHMIAPSATLLDKDLNQSGDVYENELMEDEETASASSETDYWQGAKGYWYPL